MKEETRDLLFCGTLLALLAFTLGVMLGVHVMTAKAINEGVAHYTVNERTGETTFTYKKPLPKQ